MANEGLTGWLSPGGIFYECGYGEHSELARDLLDGDVDDRLAEELSEGVLGISRDLGRLVGVRDGLELLKWVPMGVPETGSDVRRDYLFIKYDVGVTEDQMEWFEKNRERLTETQYGYVLEYLEDEDMSGR